MSTSGVSVNPKKVKAVMSWEIPKSVFEICSFLGLAGYYMRFIENFLARYYKRFIEDFSQLAALMTRLTRRRSSMSGMTRVRGHSKS